MDERVGHFFFDPPCHTQKKLQHGSIMRPVAPMLVGTLRESLPTRRDLAFDTEPSFSIYDVPLALPYLSHKDSDHFSTLATWQYIFPAIHYTTNYPH